MGYCSLFGVNDWLVYLALVCIPTEDGWERGRISYSASNQGKSTSVAISPDVIDDRF